MKSLLVGLGNPGKQYEKTRHNIGFRIVERFAQDQGSKWVSKWLLKSRVSEWVIADQKVIAIEPQTFMNLSGLSVSRCVSKYAISLDCLLVIADDVEIPFGSMRLRAKGGSGGHKGHKSIIEALGTQDYARLRIGVGGEKTGDLASFVLSPFTPEEERAIPQIIERAVDVLKIWLTEGITSALNCTSIRDS